MDNLLQNIEKNELIMLDSNGFSISDYIVFLFRNEYEIHFIEKHNKIKPFKCNKCTKSYKEYRSLISHIQRIHIKQVLYKCDFCGKGFYKKSNW